MKLILAITVILGMVSLVNIEPAHPIPKYCKVIAYVISSRDKSYSPGQKICLGQSIPSFAKVTVACASKNNRFLVKEVEQLKRCETNSTFPNRAEKNQDRGESEDNQIILLTPSGRYLFKQRFIRLVWLPVKGANKYSLKVFDGNTASSQSEYVIQNNSSSIPFPQSSTSFSVIIKSFSDIRQINSAAYTFIVSPKNTHQLITNYLSSIDKMSLSEKIKTQLKLSVLAEYNLIDDSLILLRSQSNKDSQDFESYLTLGDIQFIAGQFEQASLSYYRCKALAATRRDRAEELLAESRISLFRDFNLVEFPRNKKDSTNP